MKTFLSDITVLIPSINRDSLRRTIESIPKDCKVILLISGRTRVDKFYYTLKNRFSDYILLREQKKLSPGQAKNILIDACASKYFLVLDDDDWIPKGYLESSLNLIDSGLSWIAPSFIHSKDSLKHIVIEDQKTLLYRLFEYDKYSPDYVKFHLYPVSCTLMDTEKFKQLGEFHHLEYYDDAIPVLNFMINYPGAFYMEFGIEGDTNENSVSRRKISISTLMKPMTEMVVKYMKSQNEVEKEIWTKSMLNLLARVKHINSKLNG